MRIFISWSGVESRTLAEFLGQWLPNVLAGIAETFVSSQDVAKGERGLDVIAKELEAGTFGVVVVTRESQNAPWINFEAGALGKTLGKSHVATVLVDLTPADLKGPLSQFQATSLTNKRDVLQLLKTICAVEEKAGGRAVPDSSLERLFDTMWPDLEAALEAAAGDSQPITSRSELSILEELLDLVRSLTRDRERLNTDVAIENARQALAARQRHPASVGRSEDPIERNARMDEFRRKFGTEHGYIRGTGDVIVIVDWQESDSGIVLFVRRPGTVNTELVRMEDVEIAPF